MSVPDDPTNLTDTDVERELQAIFNRAIALIPMLTELSLGVNETSVAEYLKLRNPRELRATSRCGKCGRRIAPPSSNSTLCSCTSTQRYPQSLSVRTNS